MKLKAKNTITGLREGGKAILAGESFVCDEKEGARLIELEAAEEIEVPEEAAEEEQ